MIGRRAHELLGFVARIDDDAFPRVLAPEHESVLEKRGKCT
jgi:hypothetical protein